MTINTVKIKIYLGSDMETLQCELPSGTYIQLSDNDILMSVEHFDEFKDLLFNDIVHKTSYITI